MILMRRKLTRRKLIRMKINNATFQIKLTRAPQGVFKTHKINANDTLDSRIMGGCGIIGGLEPLVRINNREVGIIGGLEPFVIFNSVVVILRYIFPSLVPTQAKVFSKLIIGGNNNGITMSGVENFQQINYRGGGDDYSGVESMCFVPTEQN